MYSGILKHRDRICTFPVLGSTRRPSGLSPTIVNNLPSGLKDVCCPYQKKKLSLNDLWVQLHLEFRNVKEDIRFVTEITATSATDQLIPSQNQKSRNKWGLTFTGHGKRKWLTSWYLSISKSLTPQSLFEAVKWSAPLQIDKHQKIG